MFTWILPLRRGFASFETLSMNIWKLLLYKKKKKFPINFYFISQGVRLYFTSFLLAWLFIFFNFQFRMLPPYFVRVSKEHV